MTDRGTRVRWTTAALLAPTAAALFTGTTVWAAGHQPSTASSTSTPSPAPTATTDPEVEVLKAVVAENTAQVAKLHATVVALQKQARAIVKHPAKAAGYKASSSGGSSGSSKSWSSSSGSSSRTTTKVVTVPRTASAPTKTTTTSGGS